MPWSMLTFIRQKSKVAPNEKWKKQLWVFVYIKYGEFCSVSGTFRRALTLKLGGVLLHAFFSFSFGPTFYHFYYFLFFFHISISNFDATNNASDHHTGIPF